MIDLTPYTMILVSLSGGKDSLCIALETVKVAREQGVFHRLMAVYCDTDAEWFETPSVVRNHCRLLDIPLQIVYPHRGIPDYIEQRGMFPSMSCRFCTSLKTSAIEKFVRSLYPAKKECKILSVTGERREESPHRAKLCEFEIHHTLTAGKRQVFHYRPILDWNVAKVWDTINKSGIPPHPAYTEFGNERLSCALCMFACEKDLRNGAKNRPDLAQRYLEVERRTGFTFRYKQSLKDILSGETQ